MVEPTGAMDVYSFGLVMWELWHEKEPFEGELSEAIEVVLKEKKRPYIAENEESDEETGCVSAGMAELIRRCWQD